MNRRFLPLLPLSFLLLFHSQVHANVLPCSGTLCSASLQNPILLSVGNIKGHPLNPRPYAPMAVQDDGRVLEHTLPGEWNHVINYIGFWHDYGADIGTRLVVMIGLPMRPEGDGLYRTLPWDRKVFWLEIGDGVPMHLPAVWQITNADPSDQSDEHYLQVQSIQLRRPGVDYSQYEEEAEWALIALYTDNRFQIKRTELNLFDPDGNYTQTVPLEKGFQIRSWTLAINPAEPDWLLLTSMEQDFRTITRDPVVFYDHLTPNMDFPNAATKNLIDFSKVPLQFLLSGMRADSEGFIEETRYSEVKDLGMTWDGSKPAGITDWLRHWLPGL